MQISKQTNVTISFENATHTYKISEDKLHNMLMSGDLSKLLRSIQKSMKQNVDKCSGILWQESVDEFYEVITSNEFRQKLETKDEPKAD